MSLFDSGYNNYAIFSKGMTVVQSINSDSSTSNAIEPAYNNFGVWQSVFNFTSPLIKNTVNTPSIGVAGNNKDIQFNDNGSFGGDNSLQWDKNNDTLYLGNHGSTTGRIILDAVNRIIGLTQGANGVDAQNLSIEGSDANVVGQNGGSISITTGFGASGYNGGHLSLIGANGNSTGSGANIDINAGDGGATSGNGGKITLQAGVTVGGTGGEIDIFAGNADNADVAGRIKIDAGNGGQGGDIQVLAGSSNANNTNGGVVQIQSGNGNGTGANGGNINLFLGTGTSNRGRLNITGLPTSSAGLVAGDIWNNSGVLNIV